MRLDSGARFEYRKSTSGHPDYIVNQDKYARILKLLVKWDDRIFEEIEAGKFAKLEIDYGEWGNLDFLCDPRFKNIQHLGISRSAEITSLDNINCLINLNKLGVGLWDRKKSIVLSLPELKKLDSLSVCDVNLDFNNIASANSIVDLDLANVGLKDLGVLSKFAGLNAFGIGNESKIRDLSGLSVLKKLKYLNVGFLPCESLVCIDELPELEELWIIEMRKLASVKVESVHSKLNKLFINACGKLNEYSFISKFKGIQKLGISCKEINSLSFLEDLPNLCSFHFGNSKVVDGDLSFLDIHKDTADIGFGNKRHYNRKSNEYRNS
ncbi:hypothetical protein [Alteromonas sp. PRIM-21]|uniref:hypothetical protein n=1 Tax=Alteromonas sp. PRIM-21 TaxID=1454978 RepID=UPI0022B9C48C|nr:hypothetical protein [Alteromonas sp. PRIM-21]MCZ8531618.1 hypothetical protein [Alteromonas sp. PRIM-21]